MDREGRRAAAEAARKRKAAPGVYAVRCTATGAAWVGRALDVDRVWNRIEFTLRHGTHPHRSLQAAWRAHGAAAFACEALERLEEEDLPYVRDRVLKARHAHWCAALGAEAV